MTPLKFRAWRKMEGLSQARAAKALGMSPRQIYSYDKGEAVVPLYVRLAMAAITMGFKDYDGPPSQ